MELADSLFTGHHRTGGRIMQCVIDCAHVIFVPQPLMLLMSDIIYPIHRSVLQIQQMSLILFDIHVVV